MNQIPIKRRSVCRPAGFTLLIAAAGAGCGRELMPSPNVCIAPHEDLFAQVPAELRSSNVEVLYATDRVPLPPDGGLLEYGYDRSKSLAFGSCTVTIGRGLTWDELVCESRGSRRGRSLPLTVTSIRELARFPETPYAVRAIDDPQPELEPHTAALLEQGRLTLHQTLRRCLAVTPRKEAVVFIHGVGNTFEYAAGTIAQLWHFTGRVGVPVLYSWPGGYEKGMVQLYTYDRESGEFTIFHLKEFLRALAACDALEKIHLIGHSRGTDVLITALRELNIECTAAGKQTRTDLKIGIVVLAAADMDFEVISQRLVAERLIAVPERLVVYVSEGDKAMSAADWLMASKRRLGQIRGSDLDLERQRMLAHFPSLEIVDVQVSSGGFGHSYFYDDPAASSDLVRLLRDQCPAGTENCRPLVHGSDNLWRLRDDYGRAATSRR